MSRSIDNSRTVARTSGNQVAAENAALLRWMDEAGMSVRRGAWGPLLDVHGIDAFDVLVSPIYTALLKAVRLPQGASDVTARQAILDRARQVAYWLKLANQERKARWNSGRPRTVEVLFWPRQITHIDVQTPVAAALAAAGVNLDFLACHPRVFQLLRARKLTPWYTLGIWPAAVQRARSDGTARARALAAAADPMLPPFPTANPDLKVERVVRRLLLDLLPLVEEAVVNARAVFDELQPKILAIGNDITVEGRAAALVARERGVPSVVLMHGNVSGDLLHGRHVANRFLVYGQRSRDEVIRQGLDGGSVEICGAPYLDCRPTQSGRIHPQLLARLGIAAGRPWIMAAMSGPGHSISHPHHQRAIRKLVRLSNAFPSVPLVIKLHRKDHPDYYKSALAEIEHGSNLHLAPYGTDGLPTGILDWLQGCSLVLTGASTVGIEAMLLDVPVISMDFLGELGDVDFIQSGATLHVRSFVELEAAVDRVLKSPDSLHDLRRNAARYLQEAFAAGEGTAAGRAAACIQRLVANV